jgi:phage shock protein E
MSLALSLALSLAINHVLFTDIFFGLQRPKGTMDFDLKTARQLLAEPRSLLLDLRTAEEYCKGHLETAILVPTALPLDQSRLQRQLRKIFHDKSRATPIVLYCKKGKRAAAGKQILANMGFRNVSVLGGVEVEPLQSLIANKEML